MRKRCASQHQLEDLSYNFVEKQVLEAFCTFIGKLIEKMRLAKQQSTT